MTWWSMLVRILIGTRRRNGDLMVKGLFVLRLRGVERECRWAFDVCHRYSLLRTRLMHRDQSWTTFTIGGVQRLHRWHRLRNQGHHRGPQGWNAHRRTGRRWQADDWLASIGWKHSRSRVGRPGGGRISISRDRHSKRGTAAEDAGGVGAAVVAWASSAIEATAAAAPVSLLIGAQRARNEDKRALSRGKDIPGRMAGERDPNRFIPAQGRAMLRETSVLLFGYCLKWSGLGHAWQANNNGNIPNQRGTGEGSVGW